MSLPVTEDTPPDMLAGSMDLKVVLPDGRNVKMSVQRGTPMMDLLVQVTTAHCLSPGDYSLQAMGDKGVLPFKPSTPIGALDAFTVKIVEKKLHTRGRAPQVPQSFLNTFRLQVHLPRSQLFVLRVTPEVSLSEIMTHICTEKNLNMDKYEFRNPGNLEEVLDLEKTLGDYKLQDLSMMSKSNRTVTGLMSSADIMNVKSSKHRQNSVCDSSLSSGSFGSRSGSPVPPINVVTIPPQPPIRKKRRPAPKPPIIAENEKKDQTTASVLISHSRESSDSSGYHEASVLSESPTHGSPAGRVESNSPPDTLPRRSKLPSSQSFTNLTSIQPAPKTRLTNSMSNTSLNSNGYSRKKRAPPPPPPAQTAKEDKIKSSTLPTSIREDRRNNFASESSFRSFEIDASLEVPNTKVQSPVDNATHTKASKDDVPASLDVAIRLPPKPKPRTSIPKSSEKNSNQRPLNSKADDLTEKLKTLNRWKNFENLAEEGEKEFGDGLEKENTSEKRASSEEPDGNQNSADHDSINWEYQLPPPPTDFRDTNSPSCTEFGTITITPEVLENISEDYKKDPTETISKPKKTNNSQIYFKETKHNEISENEFDNHHFRQSDKKFSQNKSIVMNELTNILNENNKYREKSLSASDLYIETTSFKKNSLHYSRSFSTETPLLDNFKLTTYQGNTVGCNKNFSSSNELSYKNCKNLEKSTSMECINSQENHEINGKTEDVFRKPVAPVQKKLKIAKRSASSAGVHSANHKRNSLEINQNRDWEEDENISILRQQFLEFLKEKKLNTDLSMKSLDVIRNLLPEISQSNNNQKTLVNDESTSQNAQSEEAKEDKVKIMEVKVKSSVPEDELEQVVLRHEKKHTKPEILKESLKPAEKKPEVSNRFSYQGPPSINFSTWGERPKTTKIIIKDEDYVTREKVTEKKSELINKNGNVDTKPKEVKKPTQIVIKKPGVLSKYEMFSALPKKKEVSSLELVHMEDEEKKKMTAKEFSRVPVVCGMELKKEFKPIQKNNEPEPKATEKRHSVSVYVNGNEEVDGKTPHYNFIVPKRNSVLMPVVKGFRTLEENSSIIASSKTACDTNGVFSQKPQTNPPPPPPPLVSLVKLKPPTSVVVRNNSVAVDPRNQLLDEIRNFGGFRKLKRSNIH